MALIKLGVCIIFFAFCLIFDQNQCDTFFLLLVFWFSFFYLVTFPRGIYTPYVYSMSLVGGRARKYKTHYYYYYHLFVSPGIINHKYHISLPKSDFQ